MSAKYTNDSNNLIFLNDKNIVNTALSNETSVINAIPSLYVTENLSTDIKKLSNKIFNEDNIISNTWNFNNINVVGDNSLLSSINIKTNNLSVYNRTYLNDVEIANGKTIKCDTVPTKNNELINKLYVDTISSNIQLDINSLSNDIQSDISTLNNNLKLLSSETSANFQTILNKLSTSYVYLKTNYNEITHKDDILGIFANNSQISISLLKNDSGFITSAEVEKQVNDKLIPLYKIQPPYNGTLTQLSTDLIDGDLSGIKPENGYVWNVTEDDTVEPPIPGINVVYISTDTGWQLDKLGGTIDLKNYALSSDVSNIINENTTLILSNLYTINTNISTISSDLSTKASIKLLNDEINNLNHTTSELSNVISEYSNISSNNPIKGYWYFENGLVINTNLDVINGKTGPQNRIANLSSDKATIFVNTEITKDLNVNGTTNLNTVNINTLSSNNISVNTIEANNINVDKLSIESSSISTYINDNLINTLSSNDIVIKNLSVINTALLNNISANTLSIESINVKELSIDSMQLSNYINNSIINVISNDITINQLSVDQISVNTLSTNTLSNIIIGDKTLSNILNEYLTIEEYSNISSDTISVFLDLLKNEEISCDSLSINNIYINELTNFVVNDTNLSAILSSLNTGSDANISTDIKNEILSSFIDSELCCLSIYTDELIVDSLNNISIGTETLETALSNKFILRDEFNSLSDNVISTVLNEFTGNTLSCEVVNTGALSVSDIESISADGTTLLNSLDNRYVSKTDYLTIKTAAQQAILQLSNNVNVENITSTLIEFLNKF